MNVHMPLPCEGAETVARLSRGVSGLCFSRELHENRRFGAAGGDFCPGAFFEPQFAVKESKFPRRCTDYGGATGRASAKARASPRPKAPFGGRFFAVIADKGFVLVSEAIPVPSPISAFSVYRHRWRHLLRDLN